MNDSIYKYGKEIVWAIPLLFQCEGAYAAIYNAYKMFGIDLPNINMYGSPANAWTGGRPPTTYEKFSKEQLNKIFTYVKGMNANPTLVFTYSRLEKDDLRDPYANYLLDAALETDAHFIVNSDLLKDYIREKKSEAYIVASVTKAVFRFQGHEKIEPPTVENETNYYNELLKEYDLVVVRPEYSKKVLLKTPELIDDISRIEVLINQSCVPECPMMPHHYTVMENGRDRIQNEEEYASIICPKNNHGYEARFKNVNSIHPYFEVQQLVNSGVVHLKLQGRHFSLDLETLKMAVFMNMFNFDIPGNTVIFSDHLRLANATMEQKDFIRELRNQNRMTIDDFIH